jgi:hypothetical protein
MLMTGRMEMVERLRRRYDRGVEGDVLSEADINDVAGLLKMWMRDLPGSMLNLRWGCLLCSRKIGKFLCAAREGKKERM